uniref:Uncharacterized protein n=1 Tax=Lactuca sativa TaxID=4236 RepID=A0A9R1W9H1_LACSA|nr:hypothetical protein LSAT_V11C200054500 [Lactuca sativa]
MTESMLNPKIYANISRFVVPHHHKQPTSRLATLVVSTICFPSHQFSDDEPHRDPSLPLSTQTYYPTPSPLIFSNNIIVAVPTSATIRWLSTDEHAARTLTSFA